MFMKSLNQSPPKQRQTDTLTSPWLLKNSIGVLNQKNFVQPRIINKVQQNKGKLKIESSEEWYECVINRPAQWDDIQTNTNHVCSREDWGG
jgi:hypothetical protein